MGMYSAYNPTASKKFRLGMASINTVKYDNANPIITVTMIIFKVIPICVIFIIYEFIHKYMKIIWKYQILFG